MDLVCLNMHEGQAFFGDKKGFLSNVFGGGKAPLIWCGSSTIPFALHPQLSRFQYNIYNIQQYTIIYYNVILYPNIGIMEKKMETTYRI